MTFYDVYNYIYCFNLWRMMAGVGIQWTVKSGEVGRTAVIGDDRVFFVLHLVAYQWLR